MVNEKLNRTQLKLFCGVVVFVLPLCSILSFSSIIEKLENLHHQNYTLYHELPSHLSDIITQHRGDYARDLVSIDPDEIPLCWLMSYPRSGQSYIMNLVQKCTNISVGTNYGSVVVDIEGEYAETAHSDPANSNRGNGPFCYGTGFRPPDRGYTLTRTHCGGFCLDCQPRGYVIKPKVFKRECASGLNHDAKTGQVIETEYDFGMVKKAVHLFRDPFDIVVSRYIHSWSKCKDNGDADFLQKYPQGVQGFRDWCHDRDTNAKLLEQEKKWYNPPDYENALNVPCHSEFYKYIQWHNNTFLTSERFDLPTHMVHYEDFDKNFMETAGAIVEFIELMHEATHEPPPFEFHGYYWKHFFTQEERQAVSIFVHHMASHKTWSHVKRYMHDLDILGLTDDTCCSERDYHQEDVDVIKVEVGLGPAGV